MREVCQDPLSHQGIIGGGSGVLGPGEDAKQRRTVKPNALLAEQLRESRLAGRECACMSRVLVRLGVGSRGSNGTVGRLGQVARGTWIEGRLGSRGPAIGRTAPACGSRAPNASLADRQDSRTRTQCNDTRTRKERDGRTKLSIMSDSTFIGFRSNAWRSRIRSRNRWAGRIEYEYRDAEYEYEANCIAEI